MNAFAYHYLMMVTIDHYYQRPWVKFFKQSALVLAIETCLLLIVGYFYPYHSKKFYDYYDFLSLVQIYYLILGIIQQFLGYRLLALNIKMTLIRIRNSLGILLIYNGLHLIFSLFYLDIIVLIILGYFILKNWQQIWSTIQYVYSNLTLPMKKSLLLYLMVMIFNQMIYYYL